MGKYTQKTLIELLKSGKFRDEISLHKHIETVISNVFIFEKKVYKVYKNDSDFFNKNFRNLAEKDERFAFTKKDFEWNKTLTPSVYSHITHVAVKDGVIIEVEKEEAEEILFVMERVDTQGVLFEKLISGRITKEDCYAIGKQLGESISKAQGTPTPQKDFSQLFKDRIKDLRDWMYHVPDHVSKEEVDAYCDYLDSLREKHADWFSDHLSKEVTADGDFHSHNAVYIDGKFLLMDTYPPKEEWGLGHKHIAIYRIGVDIWGLTGKKEFFEAFLQGYEKGSGSTINRELDKVFVVYVAGIAVSYLYMLQKSDITKLNPAKKFHNFLKEYFQSIE
ncbi:MAG: hypothetical protein ACD_56C00146G0021 [uncultured bacterium]|nr:MAG: hypothetical protein ACD_56C00146G0021 [uncultured bacterium]